MIWGRYIVLNRIDDNFAKIKRAGLKQKKCITTIELTNHFLNIFILYYGCNETINTYEIQDFIDV